MKTKLDSLGSLRLVGPGGVICFGEMIRVSMFESSPQNPEPHWVRTRSFVMLEGVKLADAGDGRFVHPQTGDEFRDARLRTARSRCDFVPVPPLYGSAHQPMRPRRH